MPTTLKLNRTSQSIDAKGARIHLEDCEETRSNQRKVDVTYRTKRLNDGSANILDAPFIKSLNDRSLGNILHIKEVRNPLVALAVETNIDQARRSFKEILEFVDVVLGTRNLTIKELKAELKIARAALDQQAPNVLPLTHGAESISRKEPFLKLSKLESQARRDQVLEMVLKKKPIESVPAYAGKIAHGGSVEFFKKHYAPYIAPGCEVIFASDLKAIDEKLLIALRNECRDGLQVPIGNRSDRTDALIEGRFIDDELSSQKAHLAMAVRELRHANTEVSQPQLA